MERKIFTVSQVNKYVKQMFSYDYLLNNVWIQGEISNFKMHSTGHLYFTLKDKQGAISAVMFRSDAISVKFIPENGMKVIIKGYISLYEKTGQYQVYVQKIEPDGKGDLYTAFEQLKKKLNDEGLFEQDFKRKIPFYPNKIGIVTSGTGAAIKDIINVANRRNPTVQLVLIPVLVQGDGASKTIVRAINRFNEMDDIDLLIVGRGGGSIEDLWAFNEEIVARAVFESRIPVISAVGHETDFTISDFVSDLRAPTPSAAAELAVPSLNELRELIKNYRMRINNSIHNKIIGLKKEVELLENHPAFRFPLQSIDQNKQYIDQLNRRLTLSIETYINECKSRLGTNEQKIDILSPNNNIKRGYAAVFDEQKKNISSIADIELDKDLYIALKDGRIRVTVKSIDKKLDKELDEWINS